MKIDHTILLQLSTFCPPTVRLSKSEVCRSVTLCVSPVRNVFKSYATFTSFAVAED